MIHELWILLTIVSTFTVTQAFIVCDKSPVSLTATQEKKLLVSSDYENIQEEKAACLWTITAENASQVVKFQLTHWFAPSTSYCSRDYVLATDGTIGWARPLRLWCSNSGHQNEVVKTRTTTLCVEIFSSIFLDDRIVFTVEYWTADKDVEVINPVEFGPVNYVLIAASACIGLAFLGGIVILIYKEYARVRDAKQTHFRQLLKVRRKGISGMSMRRKTSCDSMTSEATSYIQLTETPTSLRYSSAWTPSPVTGNSANDTPTFGNVDL